MTKNKHLPALAISLIIFSFSSQGQITDADQHLLQNYEKQLQSYRKQSIRDLKSRVRDFKRDILEIKRRKDISQVERTSLIEILDNKIKNDEETMDAIQAGDQLIIPPLDFNRLELGDIGLLPIGYRPLKVYKYSNAPRGAHVHDPSKYNYDKQFKSIRAKHATVLCTIAVFNIGGRQTNGFTNHHRDSSTLRGEQKHQDALDYYKNRVYHVAKINEDQGQKQSGYRKEIYEIYELREIDINSLLEKAPGVTGEPVEDE